MSQGDVFCAQQPHHICDVPCSPPGGRIPISAYSSAWLKRKLEHYRKAPAQPQRKAVQGKVRVRCRGAYYEIGSGLGALVHIVYVCM